MQNRSNVATHQKKLLHNHLLKKVVKKCKLTKKATSQPATKKRAKYKGPTHQKKLLLNQVLKKEIVLKGQLTKKATFQLATPKS